MANEYRLSHTASEIDEKLGKVDTIDDDICALSKVTIKSYDSNVKAINHRGYSAEAPENTIPAYIRSRQEGFTYVECDVSFTSDNIPVLLHDSTIDRTSNGSGAISSMTYQQACRYDFGGWKDRAYKGTQIPKFEDFIIYCKVLGLHPYIELKSNDGYTQAQINSVVDIVNKCGMRNRVTYISFNATFLDYVKQKDNRARLGYLADITATTIATANNLKTTENEIFMDVDYNNITEAKVSLCRENDLPLEIWTVNDATIIKNMDSYISGVTSDNIVAGKTLYDKYITINPCYYFTSEDFTNNAIQKQYPYYSGNAKRCIVQNSNTVFTPGELIKIEFSGTGITNAALWFIFEEGHNEIEQKAQLEHFHDTGWLLDGDTYFVPDNTVYAWINTRGGESFSPTDIDYVKIIRMGEQNQGWSNISIPVASFEVCGLDAIPNDLGFYVRVRTDRLSYYRNRYCVQKGATYRVTPVYTTESPNLKFGVQYANMEQVNNRETLVDGQGKIDSGWVTSQSYTFTANQNGYLWICFANSSGSDTVDASKISEVRVEKI